MFEPLHVDSKKITDSGNGRAVRKEVYKLGKIAKDAVLIEIQDHEGSWTSDHWTGSKGETFTTTTYHYIEDWEMRTAMIDFKVHHGRTTGEKIFEDQISVLDGYSEKPSFSLIGITDTTGNMGKLGEHLRADGREHAYCTDHNFHLNAKLAFLGKES